MLLKDAIAELGFFPDPGSDFILAVIHDSKGIDQFWYHDTHPNTELTRQGNIYMPLVAYDTGKLERRADNAVRVFAIPFDMDLKDYLGVTPEEVHAMDDASLDMHIEQMAKDALEVFQRVNIPVHRLVSSGYGLFAYTHIHPTDQTRVMEIPPIHKELVRRVNDANGSVLADPAVTDAPTRLARLVGSQNWKNPDRPRDVKTLAYFPITPAAYLNDFKVTPRQRSVVSIPAEHELPEEIENEIIDTLQPEYGEGTRNAIAFGVSAMLAKAGVSLGSALRIIGAVAGDDEELENRLDAVERTYSKIAGGLTVAGYTNLRYMLKPEVLDHIDRILKQQRKVVYAVSFDPASEEERARKQTGNVYAPPPPECYFGWFGAYRDLVAPSTSGPDAYHLATALVYAGALLGRRAVVNHAGNQYPNLMAVLVGDSGAAHKDTCANYARGTFEVMERIVKPGGTEMLPYNVIYGLSTYEGLLEYMEKNGPRVVVHNSEYSTLITKARRETGSNLLPQLARLWDGAPQAETLTRSKPIVVANPFVSLIGTITPDILGREMRVADIELGFVNRTIWVYGSGKEHISDPPKIPFDQQVALMRELLDNFDRSVGTGHYFELTEGARRIWADWTPRNDRTHPDCRPFETEEEANVMQRLDANAKRIAMIFAASEGNKKITEWHLESAIAFLEWAYANLIVDVRSWGADEEARMERMVMRIIEQRAEMSKYELSLLTSRYSSRKVSQALDALYGMRRIDMDRAGRIRPRVLEEDENE